VGPGVCDHSAGRIRDHLVGRIRDHSAAAAGKNGFFYIFVVLRAVPKLIGIALGFLAEAPVWRGGGLGSVV
jgi:hypothetical protein